MATGEQKYTQDNRQLAITTPLGTDKLLLEEASISEGISELFQITVFMLSQPGSTVEFDKLLGQSVTITLEVAADKEGGEPTKRYYNGIVVRLGQGGRINAALSEEHFVRYQAVIVPSAWVLSKTTQSRIFQQKSVPDILKEVLVPFTVDFKLQGTYEPRNYCVQYRETDLAFAQRLMEDEGIYYYFTHADGSHKMVVCDNTSGHADVDPATVFYRRGGEKAPTHGFERYHRVRVWTMSQELGTGEYTLWDYNFELPDKNLEAKKQLLSTAAAGSRTHKLKTGGMDSTESYDYPGGFAHRFDGIDPAGSEQASKLQGVFSDNDRTVGLRMEETASPLLTIDGEGNCRQFTAGHKFKLDDHYDTANGEYVLKRVEHEISLAGAYTSRVSAELKYSNRFQCIPVAVPYRPPRVTPRPRVDGTQTATVVGPNGQEIFTDKYGRVKVQFHWDRLGIRDANSSCWVRVATTWAGNKWGAIHIPRIGQEVIVDFLEGDPDKPIIVGSVYNANNMPPYLLPENQTKSGIKSRSTLKGGEDHFNELRFEDLKGKEEIYFHAEKDFKRVVENNDVLEVGSDKADDGSQTIKIYKNRTETVETGNETITISKGNRKIEVKEGNDDHLVKKGYRKVEVTKGNDTHLIKGGNRAVEIDKGDDKLTIKAGDQTVTLNSGATTTSAGKSILLKVGSNSIKIDQKGVTISGANLTLSGTTKVSISALNTDIGGSAMMKITGGLVKIN